MGWESRFFCDFVKFSRLGWKSGFFCDFVVLTSEKMFLVLKWCERQSRGTLDSYIVIKAETCMSTPRKHI